MKNEASLESTYPDLTPERLAMVVQVIARARRMVMPPLFKEGADWAAGCAGYQVAHEHLVRAAKQHPWLTVSKASNLSWIVQVGTTPLKVNKDSSPNKQTNPVEQQLLANARQLDMQYGDWEEPVESDDVILLRMEISSTSANPITGVTLAQYEKDDLKTVLNSWELDLPDELEAQVLARDLPEAVVPAPAEFTLAGDGLAETAEDGRRIAEN